MLAELRQRTILALVHEHGQMRVSDLARRLRVSNMTVRRDLHELATRNLVTKVHGGAISPAGSPPPARSPADPGRQTLAIGRRAAALVQPGTMIALTAGTTTLAMARHLDDTPDLTVVTNSLPIIDRLNRSRRDRTLVLTGGIRTSSHALVHSPADILIRSLKVSQLFLDVHGMTLQTGLTASNLPEAEAIRALMASAQNLVALAHHTAWGKVGIRTVAELSDADTLITDTTLDEPARTALATTVGQLIVATEPARRLGSSPPPALPGNGGQTAS